MSLIESIPPAAPIAAEEKSLDKLEIEFEEKEKMINDDETGVLPAEKVPETPDSNNEGNISKTQRRPKLNIKIPQILRKRSKERPPEKVKKGKAPTILSVEGKDGSFCVTDEAGTLLQDVDIKSGDDKLEEDLQIKEEDKEAQDTSIKGTGTIDLNNSSTSFLSSLSTPKWINFRRVFSFRSTPIQMGHEAVETGGVLQIPVIFDIEGRKKEMSEDEVLKSNENQKKKDELTKMNNEQKEQKSNKLKLSNNDEKTTMTPLIQLFRWRKTQRSPEDKDVEAGEVATELLEKNSQSNTDANGLDKKLIMEHSKPDEVDGGEKNSTKTENKPVSEGNGNGMNGENTNEKNVTAPDPKSTDQLWRQRLLGFPKHNKLIVGTICTLIVLVVILVLIAALRANKTIDIGTLVISGKYINTITSCGQVQGTLEDGGYVFRGIPYAVPPIGENRWRNAVPHSEISHCWNGTFHAKNHSMPCWQFYRNQSYDGSEDCLFLDVYSPKPYYDSPVPVVVFIGGESLNGGASLKPSGALAHEKNVVFITVSIRRSVLGFLTVDDLSMNSYPLTSGNYGLSDLLAALQWVRYNAEHFGGDRNKVTLFGHQSGATLVSALTTSHLSKGLFHRVWVSGGSPPSSIISVQEASRQNTKFLKDIGCSSISCLHNKGPEELLESVPFDWKTFHQDLPTINETRHNWLVIDGVILREPIDAKFIGLRSEHQLPTTDPIKIPFVTGTSAQVDASHEMFSFLNWNDTKQYYSYLESKLGSFGPSLSREVLDRYFRPESTSWQTFASLLSDLRTICPLYYTTLERAQRFTKPSVYFYVVTQKKHGPIGYVADSTADLAAIFGVYRIETREEQKYVDNMQKLFYEFVENGRLDERERDFDVTRSIYLIDEHVKNINAYPNCEFWYQNNFYPKYSRID